MLTAPLRTNYVIVKVLTDQDGLFGVGNGTLMGGELAVKAMIDAQLGPRLVH